MSAHPILKTGPANIEDANGTVAVDVGLMVNRANRTAIGGTVHVGGEPKGRRRLALEARRRSWLSDRVAFDVGAGPLEVNTGKAFPPFHSGAAYGATSHTGLVFMDLVSVTASLDVVHGTRTQATLSLGGRLGSYAGAGAGLIVGGFAAVVGAAMRD